MPEANVLAAIRVQEAIASADRRDRRQRDHDWPGPQTRPRRVMAVAIVGSIALDPGGWLRAQPLSVRNVTLNGRSRTMSASRKASALACHFHRPPCRSATNIFHSTISVALRDVCISVRALRAYAGASSAKDSGAQGPLPDRTTGRKRACRRMRGAWRLQERCASLAFAPLGNCSAQEALLRSRFSHAGDWPCFTRCDGASHLSPSPGGLHPSRVPGPMP